MRTLRIGAVLLLGLLTAAQAPAPEKPEAGVLRLLPETSTTKHSIEIDGRTLSYAATAGTIPLRNQEGERTAEIFHVAYTIDPPSVERPVTFVFNGGPGAASAYLHLGAIGPRIIAFSQEGTFLPPPPKLVDNPDTWLDFTDLVFIDPVATGYSRAGGDEEKERAFFGVEQDAEATAAFIRLWLARAGRAGSPVFLAGESYGGFRAAKLANMLQSSAGVAPSGIALISPALEFSLLRADPTFALLPWALTLPSFAAVHFEREGAPASELPARLAEVERFALGDYLVHLAAGRQGEPGGPAIDMVARFTGLDKGLVARLRGRIPVSRFIKEYDQEDDRLLSRYDGMISGPDPEPASPLPRGPDPLLDPSIPIWTTAFVTYVREELGYRTDLKYRLLNGEVSRRWDFGTSATRQGFAGSMDDLQEARSAVPSMEVLVAHGFTDLVTPYFASRYLLDQTPPLSGAAPVLFRVYGGGHMMYMRADSRRALKEDAKALYR